MINIDIADKNRKEIADRLNLLLANEFVLYAKTLKFHWNVVGPFFGPLHALFEKQYEQILDIIDEVAERVRALGHISYGTLREFSEHATLPEEPGKNPDSLTMVRLLLEDHEAIIRQIRKDVDYATELGDAGTNNFLGELIETHEKTAWMLRSHLG